MDAAFSLIYMLLQIIYDTQMWCCGKICIHFAFFHLLRVVLAISEESGLYSKGNVNFLLKRGRE